MKKLLSLIAFVAPLITFAQVEKGMFLVTGNVSFQKNTNGQNATLASPVEVTEIEFSPSVGYMVSSRVAVGVLGSYSKTQQKQTGAPNQFSIAKTIMESSNIGAFVRYYHPITDRFFVFGQGAFTIDRSESTLSLYDPSVPPFNRHTNGGTIAIRPGISYFISKRWAVELMLGSISYTRTNFHTGGSDDHSDGFTFEFITRGVSPGVLFTF